MIHCLYVEERETGNSNAREVWCGFSSSPHLFVACKFFWREWKQDHVRLTLGAHDVNRFFSCLRGLGVSCVPRWPKVLEFPLLKCTPHHRRTGFARCTVTAREFEVQTGDGVLVQGDDDVGRVAAVSHVGSLPLTWRSNPPRQW